jgi:hypothetical protein
MSRRQATILFCFAFWCFSVGLVACNRSKHGLSHTGETPIGKDVRAETVVICCDGRNTLRMGNIGVLGERGAGRYELKTPDTGTVWVFRNVDAFPSPKVEVGRAYFETPTGFTYIRHVDLSLTNEQLAAQFGVNVSPAAGKVHK